MTNSNSNSKAFDLEDRLVAYAGEIALFVEKLPKTYPCDYYGKQVTRSSGGTALNFGEFQGTISDKDYVHKMNLSVKELKESRMSIKILKYIKAYDATILDNILDETEQLIAILSKIIINKQKKMNEK
ncbi:MAG: four helix bundle protein [Bacteroidia bacterium]|jgi:four helix bundle protein|tara:strand:- start:65 stop:448 length:384 start_codon:yes stop_codon:yes gene_type:complete